MKKLMLIMAAMVLFAVAAMAQTPTVSYQAVVRDSANRLVVSTDNIKVKIEIKNSSTVKFYEEHNTVSSNRNGLISLLIGTGTNRSGSMANVDWTSAQVTTQVQLPGTSDWVTFTGYVHAVPYALYSDNVSRNATEIVALYGKVKGDSIVQREALKDTAAALRALIGGTGSDLQALKDSVEHNFVSNDALCGKVADCVASTPEVRENIFGFVRDTIAAGNNGLTAQIVKVISDTLKDGNSALNHIVDTIAVNNVENYIDTAKHFSEAIAENIDTNKAVKGSIIKTVSDTLADGNSALNHIVDTIAVNNVENYIDTAKHFSEAIAENIDTNKAVKGSIIKTVSDTLADGNSALNHIVDTIAVKTISDSLANANSALNHAIDTIVGNHIASLEGELCGKVADCVTSTQEVRENIFKFVSDTIAAGNNGLTTNIVKVINDTLKNGSSALNHTVDTIATKNVESYIDTAKHFSEAIAENIDTNKAVKGSIIKTVSDTLADGNSPLNHIVDTIVSKNVSSSRITIKINGKKMGDFTLNQKSDSVIDIQTRGTMDRFVATAGQTVFTLANTPLDNFSVKFYINGVMVGDALESVGAKVITVDASTKKVTYTPANNGGYALKAGDRIQVSYTF